MNGQYILDENGEPKEVGLFEWGRWMQDADRVVARDEVDGATVSTVFLGIDHNFCGGGPPILWETMIFEEDENEERRWHDYQERYSSRDAAIEGHARVVANLLARLPPDRDGDQVS